jgi:uncharacterized protein involved in outer membrane biogenesis
MRRAIIIVVVVLVVLGAALAIAAANLDRWLNANRDLLAAQAEGALGRKVSFAEVGLSFRGGLGVRVDDLRVGDDPAFSKEDFLRAGSVSVLIRIWPALFGNIEVARVVLHEPDVTVIQTKAGLNTDSLGRSGQAEPGAEAEPGAPPALIVGLVDVSDGRVRFVDRTRQPTTELVLSSLDVQASELGFDEPIAFELDAALAADSDNLALSGRVGPLSAAVPEVDLELRLDPLVTDEVLKIPALRAALPEGLSASGPLSLEAKAEGTAEKLRFQTALDAGKAALSLGESFDKARGVPLTLSLGGARSGDTLTVETMELRLDDAKLRGRAELTSIEKTRGEFAVTSEALPLAPFGAGEPGEVLRDVDLKGTIAGEKITARLRSPAGRLRGTEYRDLVVDVAMAGGRVELEKVSANAYGGTIAATGTWDASAAQPRFDLKTRTEKVRVESLLAERSPALAKVLTGELDTSLGVRGSGSTWQEMKPRLYGDGNLRIADGILKKFNAAGDALRAITAIPQLGGSGIGRFVNANPQVFGLEDTPFRELATDIRIRDGWVLLPHFVVAVKDYELLGRDGARYSLDNDLDLPLDVVLSKALSEQAIAAAKELRFLRRPDGRVVIPMAVHGIPPRPTPDPQVLSKLALQVGSGLLAEKLVGSALGRPQAEAPEEGATGAEQQGAPGSPETPAKPENPTDELIRKGIQQGLEGLLGGQKR